MTPSVEFLLLRLIFTCFCVDSSNVRLLHAIISTLVAVLSDLLVLEWRLIYVSSWNGKLLSDQVAVVALFAVPDGVTLDFQV